MILPAPARTLYLVRGLQGLGGRPGSVRLAPKRTLRMLRSLRGLGDTLCTPTNCAGPYEVAVYNYDYWLTQASGRGVVDTQPGSQTETVDVTQVQQAEAAQSGASGITYDQLVAAAGVEQCAQYSDIAVGWACTQRNIPKLDAIAAIQANAHGQVTQANLDALIAQFGGTLAYTPQPQTPGAAPPPTAPPQQPPAAVRGGTLSFAPSRGGGVLQPGDTWTITIQGATPNSPVVVQGGKNGANDRTPMGSTGGNGNWSLSGTITADSIGSWAESWYVGSALSGSFSFQVVATIGASGGASSGPGSTAATGGAVPGTVAALTAAIPSWFTSTSIDGIPNWVLALGAAGLGWFFFGRKR